MRLFTPSVLSLFVAGAATAAALGQATPAQPAAPAGQPGAPAGNQQPGTPGAQPGQLSRPPGIQTTPPAGPTPGNVAPSPGAVPGQPGAPQPQPIPGQPGAPQPQPIPGQPGAPQPQPIPGQPGAPQTQPIPGQPGAPLQPAQPGAQPVPPNPLQPGPQPVPPNPLQPGNQAGQQPNGTAQVQANASFGGFGNFGFGASAPFFADQDVRSSLNLTEQQFGTLNQAAQRMMTDFRGQLDKLGNLSDADRNARAQELWNNVNSEIMTNAAKVLKPEQLDRFRQVALQYRGIDAFRDPMVQQKLTLTDDQQSHLRSVRDAFQKQAANIAQLAETNRDEARTRWQALQKEMGTRINGILTADQQKQWAELTGDPVQFSFSAEANRGQ